MNGKCVITSSRLASTLILLVAVSSHLASTDSSESEILIKFKDSLKNAGGLSTWQPAKSPCNGWKGVVCARGRVYGLQLENMGLGGVLDVESLSRLTGLRTISFMHNNLHGQLPSFTGLGVLKNVYLSGNKFSGEIPPSTFDGMLSLKKLHLANNSFSGSIPTTLASLPRLVELRLENNRLEGEIPSFQPDKHFKDFNVSNNKLVGRIPQAFEHLNISSFSGNSDLCGPPLESCSLKRHIPLATIISVAVLVAVALAAVIAVIIILCRRKRPSDAPAAASRPRTAADLNRMERGQGSAAAAADRGGKQGVRLTFLRDDGDRFDMTDLLKASAEVLGSGTCGSTYKAALNSGKVMVVKRYRQMNSVSREEFSEHMRRLGRLSHENVLPIIAYYYRKEEKLLVAEYVPNVSLAVQLHGNRSAGKPTPDWPTRLKIVKGVAKGLQYLYQELPSLTAPHGHLKSSNVVLDATFKPLLTDYGLVPVMNQQHAETNMTSYKSPEHKSSGRISRKSDIWCLGVLILEILTGKSPWENEAEQLVALVEGKGGKGEVLDKEIATGEYNEGEMMKLLEIGLRCCNADGETRPEMKEVVEKIEEVEE